MRFLVDENLPLEVASLLQRHGHDALHLSQTEHRGCSDAHLWELAARDERILVTRDLDFPLPASPRPRGVILLRVPDVFTVEQIAKVMEDFVATPAFNEVVGALAVVSPGRVRIRGY